MCYTDRALSSAEKTFDPSICTHECAHTGIQLPYEPSKSHTNIYDLSNWTEIAADDK